MQFPSLEWLVWVLGAFLCGSIPFGVLIAKSKGINLRKVGSGNIGATNVARALGRKWGFVCFGLDAIKGATPVMIFGVDQGLFGQPIHLIAPGALTNWIIVAFASIAGHIFSPWLGYKGGKGVATGFGALVSMWPVLTYPTLIALGLWLICMKLTRIVSLSSMIAALSLPLSAALLLPWDQFEAPPEPATPGIPLSPNGTPLPAVIACGLIAALVFATHRANVKRLLSGTEPRVGQKRKPSVTIHL
ncbi:MAG: glycerol-3-phosphate 1-O-acyltransferase PlsY [Planctomycetes bacterium]|nr:glycerol-3-phosphate 1-O-acyltransferase PlsY [Planctomycetota bacterium]